VARCTQAVAVGARYERPIMSSFLAVFSGGGLAGSAVGGAVAAIGVGPFLHLASAGFVLGAVVAVAAGRLLPATVESRERESRRRLRPSWRMLALGTIAFCVLMGEGAVEIGRAHV